MPDSSLKLIRLSEIPMLHDKIYKTKYKGGLKILCKNENYLIFEDKPFSFFDVVSFHRPSNRGLVFDIKIIKQITYAITCRAVRTLFSVCFEHQNFIC